MAKRASLVYQVKSVLKPMFENGFGRGRHEDKMNALNDGKRLDEYTKENIYTRNSYNSVRDVSVSFARFCQENYGTKYLYEIKQEYFNSFLERGKADGCSYSHETAKTYASCIKKLEEGCSNKFKGEFKFVDSSYKNYVNTEMRAQRDMMPRDIHDKIIERAYENKFESGLAFDTSRSLGLRVSEITNLRMNDFKLDSNGKVEEVHIHKSKGGRSREIEISKCDNRYKDTAQKVYDYFKDKREEKDRLFVNKADSYQTTFRRCREYVAPEQYNQCNIHSLRKEFANDYYDNRKEEGKPDMDIKRELTEILGHNRIEVLKSYLEQ